MEGDKRTIIIVVIVVAVVLIGGFLLFNKNSGVSPFGPAGGPAKGPGPAGGTTGGPVQLPGGPATRETVPSNVVVPGATSTNVPANVAKPQVIGPANPNNTASFRSFSITISGSAFTPNTVIVKVGDTAHINFTAVDKNYDFTQPDYGFNVSIPKGQTKLVEFSATAEGKFTFYCKTCGGPSSGPVGYIVVAPK